MTTTSSAQGVAVGGDSGDFGPLRPLSVNIRPILESVAGTLTDAAIDAWFEDFRRANEGRGFYLELTGEGELVINPMANMDSTFAEAELIGRLLLWAEQEGGRAISSRAIVRLPDGSRVEPDAGWLSPSQLAELPPVSAGRPITVCPTFVAEIMSGTDTLPPLRLKMERYIANGARLGWLIDPYRRQVHIYRPDAEPELLEDPETVSGEGVLPGFVFEVGRRIFDLHRPAPQG